MRIIDNDPVVRPFGSSLLAQLVVGKTVSHVYFRGTTVEAPRYITAIGSTPAEEPLTTNSLGYVVDANGVRIWLEEGSYDRVIDGLIYPFEAVNGASPGGREAAYSEKADVNQTGITTTVIDITNLSPISFTIEAGSPMWIHLFLSWGTHAALGGYLAGYITDASNVVKQAAPSAEAARPGGTVGSVHVIERLATAGDYTRKGRAQAGGAAGNASLLADVAFTTRLWAETK